LVNAHIRGFYQAAQLAPFGDGQGGTAEAEDHADDQVE
jgi:GntR family transcriptional repressor for pyruvate dehydrogenase complex